VILRQQLPVASPVAARSVVQAIGPALSRRGAQHGVAGQIARRFGAGRAVLTDSGTSALVLALRLSVGERGTVAFPAYGCVDLAAAARFAGIRVRLYDVDPHTLNADLASLECTLRRGVHAVLIAHLFGYPADVPAITSLCAAYGVTVIEDAAQSAGADLCGRLLGSFGPLTVLSFGRGKGVTCGSGGALLSNEPCWTERLDCAAQQLAPADAGWSQIGTTAIQWLIGRPSVYGIPANIRALRLGEMIYRPAHEPRALSAAAASLLTAAFRSAEEELRLRRATAHELVLAGERCANLRIVRPIAGAHPGFLRLPVLDFAVRRPAPRLGILRGYPRSLPEQPELAASLCAGEPAMPGALELRRRLFTLPTHSLVTRSDREKMIAWLQNAAPHS
jgi:dTDP-4-amino-4,6-dideoxygalactose transaminase